MEYFVDPDMNPCVRNGHFVQEITADDTDIIRTFILEFGADYPEAVEDALKQFEGQFENNFLACRLLIRCNFGKDDHIQDRIDGDWNMEHVYCPMRGHCKSENVRCNPKFNTIFSKRELEIIKLIAQNMTDPQIADTLYLSPETIKCHRRSILKKAACGNKQGIADYARKRNLL